MLDTTLYLEILLNEERIEKTLPEDTVEDIRKIKLPQTIEEVVLELNKTVLHLKTRTAGLN